jgi:uncharacterized protein YaiL (DUF2058 family)
MFHDYAYDVNRLTMTAYYDIRDKRIDLNDACTGPSADVLWAEEEQRLLEEQAREAKAKKIKAACHALIVEMLVLLTSQWDGGSYWTGTNVWATTILDALEERGYLKELT